MPRHTSYQPPGNERRLWISRNTAAHEVSLARRDHAQATARLANALREQARWDLALARIAGLPKHTARTLVLALSDLRALDLCPKRLLDLLYVEGDEESPSGYTLTEAGRTEAERLRKAHPELTPRAGKAG